MDKLKIGLLGFGVVGSSVPAIIAESQEKIRQQIGCELEVAQALVRNIADVTNNPHNISLTESAEEIVTNPELDVIVELMGKIEPAKTYITTALNNGKHVVTANKDLIAQYGPELTAIAQKNNCFLYYEASVGGGIPILRPLAVSFVPDQITKVFGIVNGTTNYMLTNMLKEQKSYQEALAEAQAQGFAESDPTNDVDGFDAAYKVAILSQFAFGEALPMNQIHREGIRQLRLADLQHADHLGYVIKLIGLLENENGLVAEVAPMLVPKDHPLAHVNNEYNAIYVESFGIGSSMFYGPGAGAKPTATSVVGDLTVIAKKIIDQAPVEPFTTYQQPFKEAGPTEVKGRYYLVFDEEPSDLDKIQYHENIDDELVYLTEEINQQQLATLKEKGAKIALRILEG